MPPRARGCRVACGSYIARRRAGGSCWRPNGFSKPMRLRPRSSGAVLARSRSASSSMISRAATRRRARTRSVDDDAPDALAFVHQLEPLVDVRERHSMRDHRIDLDLALHVPIDDFRHVGAAARATECRALPDASGHQLEWTGCDLRAGRGDADDDGLAPAAMTGFQRLAHDRDVAGTVEGVVGAANLVGTALCHINEVRDEVAADFFRIDEVRHPETLAPLLLGVVDVDADDHISAGKPQSLDDVEANAA